MAAHLIALLFLVSAPGGCSESSWSDPAGDVIELASPPALDVVSISTHFEPSTLVLELGFDPLTTTSAGLEQMSGFVDFDIDSSAATGASSHIDQFGMTPGLSMGMDYYLLLMPGLGIVDLYVVEDGFELPVGPCPFVINGNVLEVRVPRCAALPCDGLPIGARYQVAALIGNFSGPTDRAPNGALPYMAEPQQGDFDEDGDVDDDDFNRFQSCRLGPGIIQDDPACEAADLDGDGDVDQSDFGVFQIHITGPC